MRRLPLREFRGAAKRRREGILNVDVVVHILLRYRDNGGDWAEALQAALPDGKATPHRLQAPPAQEESSIDAAPDAALGFSSNNYGR